MDVLEYIEGRRRKAICAVSAGLVLVIAAVDYATGPEISFGIFYLVPIFLVSWAAGRNAGIVVSVLSADVSLLADLSSPYAYSHPLVRYWNAAVLLGFYLTTTFILAQLRSSLLREREHSRMDFLTGVPNSRAFHARAEMEKSRASRYRHPVTLAYLDIDDFKLVNDRLGHSVGDELLTAVASAIRTHLRQSDYVARVGGDEFAILLPEATQEAGQAVLEKLRVVLLQVMEEHHWPVTFSIGAVTFIDQPETLEEMIREADNLMYSVKHSGKNKLAVAVMGR